MYRRNLQIPADREGTSREFHKEVGLGMNVVVDLSFESDAPHRIIELPLRGRRLDDPVEVLGLIRPARIDRRASTAGEDRPYLRRLECAGDRRGDLLQAGWGREAQRGFAVRRGRRLRALVRLSSSGS